MPKKKVSLDKYFRPGNPENQVLLDSNHFAGLQGTRDNVVAFDPTLPTELARTYYVSAKGFVTTLAEVAGFGNPAEAKELFLSDPEKYNETLKDFDFSKLITPEPGDTFIYFAPGSSTPQQIAARKNHGYKLVNAEDEKAVKAISKVQKQREQMDAMHVQAEIDMHEAEIFLNDVNRVHYDISEMFGSQPVDSSLENAQQNYAQKTVSKLLEEEKDYSFNQDAELSEDQMAAIAMLCAADPSVSGKGEGRSKDACAANKFNMVVQDMYIERDNHHVGEYFDIYLKARAQAKELIDDYAESKNPGKIAKLIVDSFEIATLNGRHTPGRTDAFYGNLQPAFEIDALLKDNVIMNAVNEYVEAEKATDEKAARFGEMLQIHKDRINLLKFKQDTAETQFKESKNIFEVTSEEYAGEELNKSVKKIQANKAMLNMLSFASSRETERNYNDYTTDPDGRKNYSEFNALNNKKDRTPEETMAFLEKLPEFNNNMLYFANMKDDNPIQKLLSHGQKLEVSKRSMDAYGRYYTQSGSVPFSELLTEFTENNVPEFLEEPNKTNFEKLYDTLIKQGIIPQDPPKLSNPEEMMAAADKYYRTLAEFTPKEIAERLYERNLIHKENAVKTPFTEEEKSLMEEYGLEADDLEALAADKQMTVKDVLAGFKFQSDVAEINHLAETAKDMDGKAVTEAFKEVIELCHRYPKDAGMLYAAKNAGEKLSRVIFEHKDDRAFKTDISSVEFDAMKKIIKEGKGAEVALKVAKGIERSVKKDEVPNLGVR